MADPLEPSESTVTDTATEFLNSNPSDSDDGGFLSSLDSTLGDYFSKQHTDSEDPDDPAEPSLDAPSPSPSASESPESSGDSPDSDEVEPEPEPEPVFSDKKAGDAFKRIKGDLKEAREKLAQYESELAQKSKELQTAKERAEDLTELEDLRSQVEKYEKQLFASRVESSKKFKELVTEPLAKIHSGIAGLAKASGVDANEIRNALVEDDPRARADKLSDLAENMTDYAKMRLYALADKTDEVFEVQDRLRQQAVDAADELRKEEEKETQAEKRKRVDQYRQSVDEVANVLMEKIPMLKGDPELVEQLRSSAKAEVLGDAAPNIQAFGALSSQLVPKMAKQLFDQAQEIAQLKESLKSYQSASPGAGTGGDDETPAGVDEGLGFLDSIEKRFS